MRLSIHRDPLRPMDAEVTEVRPGPTIAELVPDDIGGGSIAYLDGVQIPERDWGTTRTDGCRYLSILARSSDFITAAHVVQFLIASAVSFVAAKLFPPPGPPKQRDDNKSATYSFGGLGNNRFEGLPIPVGYGKMRVGGQIINEWIEANAAASPESYLYIVIALGEGPWQEIAGQTTDTPNGTPLTGSQLEGVLIDGNAAENFDGVEGWVRMGTSEQTSIDGFHKLYTANTVALGLLSQTTSSKDNSESYLSGSPYDTSYDSAGWDEYGVAYDVTDEVDGAVLRINFPGGLFTADNSGAYETAYLRVQVRYIELDGSNNPITTGGPNGDGYVRSTPSPLITGGQREQFSREFGVQFLDPQTWAVPVTGRAMTTGGSSGEYGTGYAAAPVNASNNPYADFNVMPQGWTASVWIKLNQALPTSAASSEELMIFGNFENTNNAGFHLAFKNRSLDATPDWRLQAKVEGAAGVIFAEDPDPTVLNVDQWYLVSMTYGFNVKDGNNDRIRVFLNDARLKSNQGPSNFRLAGAITRDIRFLRGFDFTNILDADLDDATIIDKELGTSYILDRYQTKVSGPEHPDMIARWKFDDSGSSGGVDNATQDITVGGLSWFGDAELFSTATSGSAAGVVQGDPSGTPKRSKYRIEVLRLNKDSDNALTVDEAELESVNQYTDDDLSYPEIALLGLKIKATEQLNTTTPTVTSLCKMRKPPVWDGVSTAQPDFVETYTSNPAWVSVDAITNRSFGMGEHFNFSNIDVASFGAWADYCDEVVYDGSVLRYYDADSSWGDIRFESASGGGRGLLIFIWATGVQPGNLPPSSYVPGTFVRVHGVGTVSGQDEVNLPSDSDPTAVGGYEVAQGTYWNPTVAAWAVDLYWDRPGETPWTDNTNRQAHSPALTSSAYIEGAQRRFEVHGVFDEEKKAQDALGDISTVGRAAFYQLGTKIRVRYESPRAAVALIGRGSIIDGSFRIEYTGPSNKPNSLDYSFLDADIDYERNTWPVLDPSVDNANSAVQIRKQSSFLWGVTSRAQVERHGNYVLNANRLIRRAGRFHVGIDGLQLEMGDVVLVDYDLLPRGVGGRLTGEEGTATKTTFKVGEAFTLESGKTYKVYVKDWRNQSDGTDGREEGSELESADLKTPAPPGSGSVEYPAGTEIVVENGPGTGGGFTAVPKVGVTTFCIVASGEELEAEVVEILMREDQTREIRWVQYLDALFDDDLAEPETAGPESDDGLIAGSLQLIDSANPAAGTKYGGPGNDSGAGRASQRVFPPDVSSLTVRDIMPRDRSGGRRAQLHVTWRPPVDRKDSVGKTEVYWRHHRGWIPNWNSVSESASGPWILGGTAQAGDSSVDVRLTGVEAGDVIQVAARHVTRDGVAAPPIRGSMLLHTFVGAVSSPRRVTTPAAEQEGDRVRYTWTNPQNAEEECQVEIRRGGWVLGQVVHVAPPGAERTDPIHDWAGVVSGGTAPSLYFSPRDRAGQYAEVREMTGFEPDPDLSSETFASDNQVEAWENWGDGWVTDTAAPAGDPGLSDLERHADGYLTFSGSTSEPLVGVYATRDNLNAVQVARRSLRPMRVFVEAAVVAEQIHPADWSDDGYWQAVGDARAWAGPETERWTWEGPRYIVNGEDQVRLYIQWRRTVDGATWGDWGEFKPGAYNIIDAQFRLRAVRPNADFDIRIHSFSTRIRVPRETVRERTQRRSYFEREFF